MIRAGRTRNVEVIHLYGSMAYDFYSESAKPFTNQSLFPQVRWCK